MEHRFSIHYYCGPNGELKKGDLVGWDEPDYEHPDGPLADTIVDIFAYSTETFVTLSLGKTFRAVGVYKIG